MAKVKKNVKGTPKSSDSPFQDYWKKNNYIIFIVGIGVIIFGYVMMAQSPWDNPLSLSVSPLILLIGYIIIIPLAILYRRIKKNRDAAREG